MDYLVGFLFGYFCSVFYNSLQNFSTNNSYLSYYKNEDEFYPLTEDDLP